MREPCIWLFEKGSHCIAQASLEPMVTLLYQPPNLHPAEEAQVLPVLWSSEMHECIQSEPLLTEQQVS